jgi:hypothetical protein
VTPSSSSHVARYTTVSVVGDRLGDAGAHAERRAHVATAHAEHLVDRHERVELARTGPVAVDRRGCLEDHVPRWAQPLETHHVWTVALRQRLVRRGDERPSAVVERDDAVGHRNTGVIERQLERELASVGDTCREPAARRPQEGGRVAAAQCERLSVHERRDRHLRARRAEVERLDRLVTTFVAVFGDVRDVPIARHAEQLHATLRFGPTRQVERSRERGEISDPASQEKLVLDAGAEHAGDHGVDEHGHAPIVGEVRANHLADVDLGVARDALTTAEDVAQRAVGFSEIGAAARARAARDEEHLSRGIDRDGADLLHRRAIRQRQLR